MSYIQQSLLVEINKRTQTTITPVVQTEIAHLMNLHRRISCLEEEREKQPAITEGQIKALNLAITEGQIKALNLAKRDIEIAIKSLIHPEIAQLPIILSKKLRYEVEYFINTIKNPMFGRLKNLALRIIRLPSAKTKVIIGLALAVPFCITLAVTVLYHTKNIARATLFKTTINTLNQSNINKESQSQNEADINAYAENISLVILAGSVGAFGSIVSIISRIKQYDYDSENYDYEDYFLPFLVGLFKPAIGAGFGILIVAIIEGGILPLKVENEPIGTKQFFYMSVAFIMGFSERFAQDLVKKVAGSITNEDKKITDSLESNTIKINNIKTESSSPLEDYPLKAIQETQNKIDIENSAQSTSISVVDTLEACSQPTEVTKPNFWLEQIIRVSEES